MSLQVRGTAGNDLMTGTDGDDLLLGLGNSDTLLGLGGNDHLAGNGDNDLIFGDGTDLDPSGLSYGNDLLEGDGSLAGWNEGEDYLDGGSGNDTLRRQGRSDTLLGGAGDDRLEGGGDGDLMYGDSAVTDPTGLAYSNDWLDGGDGRDQMMGGGGADTLIGGNGDDLLFGDDLGGDVPDAFQGADLLDGGAGNDDLEGGGQSDTLIGGTGNDTLRGDSGDDLLQGGSGSDTYVFGRGDGRDTVVEDDSTVGNTDVLQLGAGASQEQLWFRQLGNDLEMSLVGTADRVLLQDWYAGSAHHVEQLQTSNGRTLLDSKVQALVQAMAAFSPPAMGQTSLSAEQQTALAPVIAANWAA